MSEREVILKTALFSRLLLVGIQYISNILIPDHEADAYLYPNQPEASKLDVVVTHFCGGFLRWDAQHFMHIVKYGYTYEHTLAFFPLFPYSVRFITKILSYVIPGLSQDSLILLVALAFNIFCFIQSTLHLYELSLHVVGKDCSYKATILFCYNPASIFFLAPYTEALFSYLTFKSMLNCVLLYKKYSQSSQTLEFKDITKVVPICFSALTRSNGVLNLGFLIYIIICLFLEKVKLKKQIFEKVSCTLSFIVLAVFLTFFSLSPFIFFQIYSYQRFCKDFPVSLPDVILNHKDVVNFVLPGKFSKYQQSWCSKTLPLSYSYIQAHYWKVGFLQYYEIKQIPNFLLGAPIIFIILEGAFKFFQQFPKDISKLFNFNILNFKVRSNEVMAVFVIHATALTFFCILNIHVQVTTRMLCSATPVVFWFASKSISDLSTTNLLRQLNMANSRGEFFVLLYFVSYYVVGTIMFCNFLPWT